MSNKNISSGIALDCGVFTQPIGANKDLVLINYSDFDYVSTSATSNRQVNNSSNNIRGLTDIILKPGAVQYIFEGTDYSVIPTVSPEVREDGNLWYSHSLSFTVYSKKSKDREVLLSLGKARVIAVTIDRSTGLFELFGMQQGLKVSTISRSYNGAQNSNFYQVTIATPDINVIKEKSLGELSVNLNGVGGGFSGSSDGTDPPAGVYGDATPTVQGLVRVDQIQPNPIVYLKSTVDQLFELKSNKLSSRAEVESNLSSIVKYLSPKAMVDWVTQYFETKLSESDTSKYYRGDKVWATLDKNAVGLGNVDNISVVDFFSRSKIYAEGELLIFKKDNSDNTIIEIGDFVNGIVEGVYIQAIYTGTDPTLLTSFNIINQIDF